MKFTYKKIVRKVGTIYNRMWVLYCYDMHRLSHFDKSYNISVTSRVAGPQREAGYRVPWSDCNKTVVVVGRKSKKELTYAAVTRYGWYAYGLAPVTMKLFEYDKL